MEVKKLPLAEISLADYNPRKDLQPGDEEYENLRRSIKEFGYVSPIIVNQKNYTVIGGHQRYKVLKELGYTEINVVLVDFDEESEKVLNLSLNKIEGDWDIDKLEMLFADFEEEDFDSTLTGFSEEEIDELLGNSSFEDEESDDRGQSDSSETDSNVVCPRCQHVEDKKAFEV